jgi:hypothetical protein
MLNFHDGLRKFVRASKSMGNYKCLGNWELMKPRAGNKESELLVLSELHLHLFLSARSFDLKAGDKHGRIE